MMKCSIMRHFIWAIIVCKSNRLGVSGYDFEKKMYFCLKIFFTSVEAHCGISSGSSLFVKVVVLGFPVYKGLKGVNSKRV